jgi:hypothetical protein
MSMVHILYKIECFPEDDTHGFLTTIHGDVTLVDSSDLKKSKVVSIGSIEIVHFGIAGACDRRIDLRDLIDEEGGHYHALIHVLDLRKGEIKQRVLKLFDQDFFSSDILLINHLEILVNYRGFNYGLQAMVDAIRRFGGGCGLALVSPAPQQFNAELQQVRNRSEANKIQGKRMVATRRLAAYYRRIGFRAIPRTGVMALPLSRSLPSIDRLRAKAKRQE